ncbi:MAG: DUF2828 family protein [Eubacteriales bacterium]|nr:DUF2828 family protein [Eubacteriales bacterium]
MRTAEKARLTRLFSEAWREDPLFATKIAFYARDVRGGLGERQTFRTLMKFMADYHPEALRKNLDLIGAILIVDQRIHLFDVIELTDGGFLRLDRFVRGFFCRALCLFDGSRTVRRSLRCRILGLLRSHAGVRVFADFSVFFHFARGVLQNFCVHFFLIQSKTSRIESCVDDLYGKCSAVQASQQCVGTQL